jgi:uncharacterized protein (DUF2267 family)
MQQDRFIKLVQNRARLASRGEAEVITRAVLETLAERLAGNEAANAAAQLPQGLAAYLDNDRVGTKTKYSLNEFLKMVSLREGAELPQATHHTRVVMEVLGEAISKGEMDDIKTQLPPEYDAIFAGSQGQMPVSR